MNSSRLTSVIGTLSLVSITFISKFIGFIRELLLLDEVGLNATLDAFIILFSVTTVVTGIAGSIVFTNIAPIARKLKTGAEQIRLLYDGARYGVLAFVITLVLNLAIAYFSFARSDDITYLVLLPLIVSIVSFFIILGEYQASIFVAWGRNTPIIFGNILVSLPLILLLLVSDLNIITYAIGLVASFFLRTVIWLGLAKYNVSDFRNSRRLGKIQREQIANFWIAAIGSSAMTALQLALLVLMIFSQNIGEGIASSFSYGFRLPYLLITTIWFVYGLKFFSEIIEEGLANLKTKILKMTLMNFTAASLLGICCTFYITAFPKFVGVPLLGNPDYLKFVSLSFWALPICLFYPLVEMTQRALVVAQNHINVGIIAGGILFSTLAVSSAVSINVVGSPEALLFCLSLISGLAAGISLWQLRALALNWGTS